MGEVRNGNDESAGLMDKLRSGAASQLGTQKDRATEGVTSVTQAVRQSTQQLRDNKHETIAQYVEQAVDQVDRFADRLKQKDVGELMQDAQRFARRNPAVFVGAAFGVGVAAARFLKSSNRDAEHGNGSWRDRTGAMSSDSNWRDRTAGYTSAGQGYGGSGSNINASTPSTNPGTERF